MSAVVKTEPALSDAVYTPLTTPSRPRKSRRTITGTTTLPTAIAAPITTVPVTAHAKSPSDRTTVPSATTARDRRIVVSRLALRMRNAASGVATANSTTGMLEKIPAAATEIPRPAATSCTIGATATIGPRRLSA